ncbi:bsu-protein phosphatase [Tritrichomonas foetus]|uniref:Bsu-protein phosphatase n=1 Tax=Tritrichomonas foetus TaxID=1144522 RepID=A0A1J4KB27_9EUKA|nr:bsu-protein phosphatase [Tritrichomonas foetus]|eukprot:OHT08623.1 bsu-protein phosphatase [Tritrichomonas foetus]
MNLLTHSETRAMNAMYGFEKECTTKYNRNVYEAFAEFFNTLPIGHVLNGKVLVVHGGLSDSTMTIEKVNASNRFCQPPEQGIINDVLWADPMDSPGLAPSPRGITRTFGPDVTQRVLSNNNLSYLVRSHQVQENGYLLQHNRKCITVFSAPNYIGSMQNKGAICDFTFDADGSISDGPTFVTFGARPIPRMYPPMKFSPFGSMF